MMLAANHEKPIDDHYNGRQQLLQWILFFYEISKTSVFWTNVILVLTDAIACGNEYNSIDYYYRPFIGTYFPWDYLVFWQHNNPVIKDYQNGTCLLYETTFRDYHPRLLPL